MNDPYTIDHCTIDLVILIRAPYTNGSFMIDSWAIQLGAKMIHL